jgi:hypothetical protein
VIRITFAALFKVLHNNNMQWKWPVGIQLGIISLVCLCLTPFFLSFFTLSLSCLYILRSTSKSYLVVREVVK